LAVAAVACGGHRGHIHLRRRRNPGLPSAAAGTSVVNAAHVGAEQRSERVAGQDMMPPASGSRTPHYTNHQSQEPGTLLYGPPTRCPGPIGPGSPAERAQELPAQPAKFPRAKKTKIACTNLVPNRIGPVSFTRTADRAVPLGSRALSAILRFIIGNHLLQHGLTLAMQFRRDVTAT